MNEQNIDLWGTEEVIRYIEDPENGQVQHNYDEDAE